MAGPSGEELDPPASPPNPGARGGGGKCSLRDRGSQHLCATWTVLAAPGGSPEVKDSGHYRDPGSGEIEASLKLEVKGKETDVGFAARI